MEAMHLNMNEHLSQAWNVVFPKELLPVPAENIIKSVISGIIIIREATVHVYLASYLLLIFPVLKEKRGTLLMMWLAVSGFRSIIVNGITTLVGIFLCSCQPEPHPACFEFLGTKGVELACSAYMWVLVNEFFYYIKRPNHRSMIEAKLRKSSILKSAKTRTDDLILHTIEVVDSFSDSEWEYEERFSYPSDESESTDELSGYSSEAMIAEAAVNWFFRQALGMKCIGKTGDRDEELANKFLQMSPEEVEKLTQKIKVFLSRKSLKSEKPSKVSMEKNMELKSDLGLITKLNNDKKKKVFANSESLVSQNKTIKPIFKGNIEPKTYRNSRNEKTQTDPLPKSVLKMIEKQEKRNQKNQ